MKGEIDPRGRKSTGRKRQVNGGNYAEDEGCTREAGRIGRRGANGH